MEHITQDKHFPASLMRALTRADTIDLVSSSNSPSFPEESQRPKVRSPFPFHTFPWNGSIGCTTLASVDARI